MTHTGKDNFTKSWVKHYLVSKGPRFWLLRDLPFFYPPPYGGPRCAEHAASDRWPHVDLYQCVGIV